MPKLLSSSQDSSFACHLPLIMGSPCCSSPWSCHGRPLSTRIKQWPNCWACHPLSPACFSCREVDLWYYKLLFLMQSEVFRRASSSLGINVSWHYPGEKASPILYFLGAPYTRILAQSQNTFRHRWVSQWSSSKWYDAREHIGRIPMVILCI